jgi:hypothetical protein
MELGQADVWATLTNYALLKDDAGKTAFTRYAVFRSDVTGAAYALPRARRWGLWLCCAAYMKKYESPYVTARRAVAGGLIAEVLTKPDAFPTLRPPADAETEEAVALALKDVFEKKPLSLAEDKAVRDALRALAAANDLFAPTRAGQFALPNGQAVALDPEQDKPLREKRDAWIKQQRDKARQPKK